MTLQLAILRAAAWLVPREERGEWLAEWRSELWYLLAERRRDATAFCLGALSDAFWLRRDGAAAELRNIFHMRSAVRCVLSLAVLAGAGCLCALFARGVHGGETLAGAHSIVPHLLMIFYALLVLPVTTRLDFSEYPAHHDSLSGACRRWIFFATKTVLLLLTSSGIAVTLLGIGAAPVMPPVLMAGNVFALRWALMDQRRRCPVCLEVLANPVRIGQPSRTLLAWYGTELICAKGHGVLQVPEVPTSCYGTQRWLYLE